jgi:hypothetical protein
MAKQNSKQDDAARASKFKELGAARTTRALKSISAIGKLSNPRSYAHTPAQVEKIAGALRAAVDRLEKQFAGKVAAEGFEL